MNSLSALVVSSANSKPTRAALVIGLILLATFLRVFQLDTLPPGLHFDEAFNGTQARGVLHGAHRPIFFTGDFGEEPLHIYTEALLFALVGESPWAIRLTSAFFGILLVPAVYASARGFFPRRPLVALTAAFVCATLYWPLNFSRIGIETVTLPTVLTLSAASLAFAYRRPRGRWFVQAGFLLAATVYTYLASRLWPVVFALWFLYLLVFHRHLVRRYLSRWVVLAVVALLTFAPLGLFFVANPVAFIGRSGQVWTPEMLETNLVKTAGMFLFSGDTDPRDNLPGRPALDPFLGALAVIGLVLALREWNRPLMALLVIWFVVMTLPSALTEFAPNFRRAMGTLPALLLLCGLGLDWLWGKLTGWLGVHPLRALAAAALALLLAGGAVGSAYDYFVRWGSDPGLYYSFDAGILKTSEALTARPPSEVIYLSPDYDEHYTVLWAMNGRPFSSFDGRKALLLPDSARGATYGIISYQDKQSIPRLRALASRLETVTEFADLTSRPYSSILHLAPGQSFATEVKRPLDARLGSFAVLDGLTTSPWPPVVDPGQTLNVTLQWTVLAPVSQNYTVFVHLSGPPNPKNGSPIWAQADSQPGGGSLPTSDWRAGQVILDTYTLQVPAAAPPGDYKLEAGMYLLGTGERVPATDARGASLADGRVLLLSVTVN